MHLFHKDSQEQEYMILLILQKPYWIVFATVLHPDEDILYVVDGWYGLFSTNVSEITSINPPFPQQLIFKTTQQFPGFVIIGASLNYDKKYLIISLKSVGLKIYDISQKQNKEQPPIIYQLECSYYMKFFIFSKGDSYLYILNGIQIVTHEKVIPNLNKDFPNVFNTKQSTLTFLGNEFWPYHIHVFKDGKIAAVNVGLIGTKLFDISDIDHPILLSTIQSINGTSQDIVYAHPSNEDVLYVGGSELGIHIFDIKDKKNPILLSTYAPNSNFQNNCDGIDINEDRSIVIIGNSDQGISIANFKDLKQPKKYSNYPSLFNSNVKKVKLSKDNKFAYLAALEIGLIIISIQDPEQPTMVSYVNQMVGETPQLSLDGKYVYLANGFSGVTIINVENPLSPYKVSSIPTDGWVMNLFTMFNETYIFACQSEKGQITVVDISDKQNPYIFAKYQNIDEHSLSISHTPNNSAALILGGKGLRILPLQSSITIHSQYKEISNEGKTSKMLNVGESLKVGSTVYITFASVKTDREIVYEDALYYQNFEIKKLPPSMQFVSNQKQLIIQVNKDGVNNNAKGENIILLQLSAQVTYKEIMKIHPFITIELAFGIIQSLVQANYLNEQQFLDDSFNPTKNFYLDFYTMLNLKKDNFLSLDAFLQNSIHSLLKYSKIQYPIRFFVSKSLFLNKNNNFSQVINTPSKLVEVYLNILSGSNSINPSGVFIKKAFQGVLAVYQDELDQLKLEGSLNSINLVLNKNIQIVNFTSLENIQIKYTISDGSNYNIDEIDTLNNLEFLSLNQDVILNKSIQDQLYHTFSESGMYVAEQFNFKLDSQTFIDKDTYNQILSYTAYFVHSSDNLKEIKETTDPIQFNSRERTFTGTIKSSDLFSSIRIRVFASDGYSKAQDDFVMKFNLMPISLIFELILKIVAPIIGALGFWRYRSFIQRLSMKSFYTQIKEYTIIGTEYRKKIVLMNAIQDNFEKLWTIYIKQNKHLKQDVWLNYEKNKEIFIEDLIVDLEKIYKQNPKKYPYIHENEFILKKSRLNHVLQLYVILILLQKSEKQSTLQAFNALKKKGIKALNNKKNWYRYFLSINTEKDWKIKKKQEERRNSTLNHISLIVENQGALAVPIHSENYTPFPQIDFYEDKINREVQLSRIKCDSDILKDLIKLEAFGIISSQPFRLNPARGESLHLVSCDLISVNAFIKDKSGTCKFLKKFLEIDYKPIGLYHNSPLPSWLNCDIVDDVIYLWGKPTIKDEGCIQIRLNDIFGFTVMQYDLEVTQKDQDNPIKKLSSMRDIKIKMRQNNISINSFPKEYKHKQSESDVQIFSNTSMFQKQQNLVNKLGRSLSQTVDGQQDEEKQYFEEKQDFTPIEFSQCAITNNIRQFGFIPSQVKSTEKLSQNSLVLQVEKNRLGEMRILQEIDTLNFNSGHQTTDQL